MPEEEIVTRRGVYKDLKKSPYEYTSPYGDVFKFSSAKKLEIYTRDVGKEVARVKKLIRRLELDKLLSPEFTGLLIQYAYRGFYRQVEG